MRQVHCRHSPARPGLVRSKAVCRFHPDSGEVLKRAKAFLQCPGNAAPAPNKSIETIGGNFECLRDLACVRPAGSMNSCSKIIPGWVLMRFVGTCRSPNEYRRRKRCSRSFFKIEKQKWESSAFFNKD